MKNKSDRPEWFKFWRRNRLTLDIDVLSMESRGKVFTNMMRYYDTGEDELIEMTDLESMAFTVLKIAMDDSFSEYRERKKKNTKNGEKGGRPNETAPEKENPVGYSETEKTQSVIKNPVGGKIDDRVQKIDDRVQKEEVRRQKRDVSIYPTLEEVRNYCMERKSSVDPEAFYEYYQAGGWKDKTGSPVRNWKQKLITWEKREVVTEPDIRNPARYEKGEGSL